MAAIRKTAKYYREELVKTQSMNTLNTLIKEVVAKFGSSNDLYIAGTECNWNHWVRGFSVGKNGILYVNVYWQGDSTDGNDCVPFSEVFGRGKSVIRAETYWDGYRTRITHGDIIVEKFEVDSLIKLLAEWLSPTAIKARKVAEDLRKIKNEISSILGNAYFTKYARKWGNNEEYYNGKGAVNEWVEKQGNDLLKMEKADIFAMVDKIFKTNYKNDSYFGKTNMWSSRTKPYIISF
jgi:hypothetical protein